ncbi:bifunctional glutamate N-acetyltransferase/amino-acid acetyltransferase ArgJ [Feifania hominis]|uniref:Arginine biosynthesis bifunctional protein ArgJ n=1 Tax=Feifania hominis TaxID=2763660 RepID=A0A926HQZ3_9FIRM|nr:bifunctional glutamate N-acetyltransferase/amino-acid acetyltransferase ArgJ [Feifania hominis]MBC8536882.1 bifunctional glutamate N-acetyltransferase/amino-acid acetyltransferase ArgJ [Feifania hominis]
MKPVEGGVTAPKGFRAAGIHCGIRKNKTKKDLALIVSDCDANVAAVYTQNVVKGAPNRVTKEHMKAGNCRAILCNSGIANTCETDGVEKAEQMAAAAAQLLGVKTTDVAVASTGVIGQPLPVDVIAAGLPQLVGELSPQGGHDAAVAIMTTDTYPKEAAAEFTVGGKTARIGAIAKGSGMINPNMATMLSFITSDCAISSAMLDRALREVVGVTYNCLVIDGDTSTNDMVILLANGQAQNAEITGAGPDYEAFEAALLSVCRSIVKMLAADGEGATKYLECHIRGCRDTASGRVLAKSVMSSSLVKTAFFGADANWGRILCALGYSGVDFDPQKVNVSFHSAAGDILVCQNGGSVEFSEELAKRILSEKEITLTIEMHEGEAEAVAYGCDLTYDYVKINGDYRT